MSAPQETETRTSPSDGRAPSATNARPGVRPDNSAWEMREFKQSLPSLLLSSLGLGALYTLPAGVLAALVTTAYLILRADGIESGLKIVGALAIALMLTILGVVKLLTGRADHASTVEDHGDRPADD